jgi:tetratricopeptide (TPR) repeat protein
LFYFRGLVELYLGKYDEALEDIIRAISKSEENVAKHFFFRGMIYA